MTAIGQNTLTIDDPAEGTTILVLEKDTKMWDDSWVQFVPTEVGDQISAIGSSSGPGQFRVDKYYVNLDMLVGKVVEVGGGPLAPYTFVMTDRYDHMRAAGETPHRVHLDQRTRVPKKDPSGASGVLWMQELALDPWPMKLGDTVQVSGRRKDGVLLAAAVFPS